MFTLSKVNKALTQYGVELVRGKDYLYFVGDPVRNAYSASIGGVFRLNQLTLEQWVAEAQSKIAESNKR